MAPLLRARFSSLISSWPLLIIVSYKPHELSFLYPLIYSIFKVVAVIHVMPAALVEVTVLVLTPPMFADFIFRGCSSLMLS
jgi:hypothetical protein